MTNILKGIQYRDLTDALPTWNVSPYSEWKDAEGSFTFAAGTQFRVKPDYYYVATTYANNPSVKSEVFDGTKDKVMEWADKHLENSIPVTITKNEKTKTTAGAFLAENNIQFSINECSWRSCTYLSEAGHSGLSRFRLRPDYIWVVSTSAGIAVAETRFDDNVRAAKYLSDKILTDSFDSASMRKERYAG